jgi:iron(III) transport system substrate-binding protein
MSLVWIHNRGKRLVLVGTAFVAAIGMIAASGESRAAAQPTTVADIALYQGGDRQQILVEGAQKEGQLVFYNSYTWMATVAQMFEKKYPFLKVAVWRSESASVIKRVTEEYASERFLADIIELSDPAISLLRRKGIFQEFYSPEAAYYKDEVKAKGKLGVYYVADLEPYIGLGFNTKLISPRDAPRSYSDLLDPKWKGKISFAGTATGVQWIGNVLNAMGREYIEKFSRQEIRVQNIAAAALAGLVVSGEAPLSPTIISNNVFTLKKKGAPIEWRPLEPVVAQVGFSGITTKAPHPHAALLFLDYVHSKEGQEAVMSGGVSSPREDMASPEQKFKKTYLGLLYTPEELEKRFGEWQELMTRLFIKKM